jgi:hypothetical protein
MTNMPESGEAPGDSPKPAKPLNPKRRRIPTPKSEIEKAEPHIPDSDEQEDPEEKFKLLADVDSEKDD